MSVTEHQHLEQLDVHVLLVLALKCLQEAGLCLIGIPVDKLGDGLLLTLGATLVEERFEGSFEVEGHRTEAGAFEEEVKLHVLLRLRLRGNCFLSTVGPLFFVSFDSGFLSSYCAQFLFGGCCCFG